MTKTSLPTLSRPLRKTRNLPWKRKVHWCWGLFLRPLSFRFNAFATQLGIFTTLYCFCFVASSATGSLLRSTGTLSKMAKTSTLSLLSGISQQSMLSSCCLKLSLGGFWLTTILSSTSNWRRPFCMTSYLWTTLCFAACWRWSDSSYSHSVWEKDNTDTSSKG